MARTKQLKPSPELLVSGGVGATVGQFLEPIAIAHGIPPGAVTALSVLVAHWLQGKGRAQ
jgi:hypothetical protein